MIELANILQPEAVMPRLDVSSKKQLLWEASRRAMQVYGVDENKIFKALIARERLGSTIIHEGVALPHAKLPDVEENMMVLIRLVEPVKYDIFSNDVVDLVLMLLVPDRGGAEHLRLFAHCSQLFGNQELCDALRLCPPQTRALLELLNIKYEEKHSHHHIAYSL